MNKSIVFNLTFFFSLIIILIIVINLLTKSWLPIINKIINILFEY
jgi:hypothetical protein